MSDTAYIPSSGALSGPSLVIQNEATFSRLGIKTEQAHGVAREALDIASEALAQARRAFSIAQEAVENIDQARLWVNESRDVSAQTETMAANALVRANEVFDLAAIVVTAAERVREILVTVRATTAEAVSTTAQARQTVLEALAQAQAARRAARAAVDTARQTLGTFLSAFWQVEADTLFSQPARLHVLHPASTGLPAVPPLFLQVQTADSGQLPCQTAWNGETLWRRTAEVTRAVHPGTETLLLELAPAAGEEEEDPPAALTGALTVTSTGAALTLATSLGVFRPSLSLPHMVKGTLAIPVEEHFMGELTVGGEQLAHVDEEGGSTFDGGLETDKGHIRAAAIAEKNGTLEVLLVYEWLDADAPEAVWSDWSSHIRTVRAGQFNKTDEAVDADLHTDEACRLYLTNPACTNLPLAAPLFFTVLRDTGGHSVTQFAWGVDNDGPYLRTARLDEGAPAFTAWRSLARYRRPALPDAGGLRFPAVPFTRVSDLGDLRKVRVGLDAPGALLVAPSANLTVDITQLGRTVDKQTIVIIRPSADIAISWEGETYAPEWTGTTQLLAVAANSTAVVSIRQVEGLIALEAIFPVDQP